MRQVVIPRYGAPDVLELREAPDPEPREGQVRIRVRAAGVNFADLLARLGFYPDAPKLPAVVGYEVAGYVEEVGPGVTHPREGDRVLAFTRFGGYADSVVVPAAFAFPIPSRLSEAEAAAIPVNFLTAFLALYRMAHVSADETVLIHGAGGGVGSAAVQLARLRRATIIGTASAAKHEALRRLGVDHLIDYHHTDVADQVRRLTGGRGADVVLDPIGGASFRRSYDLLAPLGRLVVYGVSSVAPGGRRNWWQAARTIWRMPSFKPTSMMHHNRGVFGLNLGHLWQESRELIGDMKILLQDVASDRLHPLVARTFPLERAADAHRFMHDRANIGKVVLTT
jgi:NADPH:quinone reductase-like Zn-dependent oxidoreductase